jgi:hypothetical protein
VDMGFGIKYLAVISVGRECDSSSKVEYPCDKRFELLFKIHV